MGIINPAELDLKEEVVVKINRTAKVASRGKRFRFSALVVVGDGAGHVGVGLGMGDSLFCLVPGGTSPWTNHLYESFFAGCIPVIISDLYTPSIIQ